MRPFSDYELRNIIAQRHQELNKKIDQYTNDEIMANDLELLADNCFEEYKIVPVIIGEEEFVKRRINQQKVNKRLDGFFREKYGKEYIEVDGVVANFYFPFSGDNILFMCQASTFSVSGYPDIALSDNFVIFTYHVELNELPNQDGKDKLLLRLEHDIKSIKSGIDYANNDANNFNKSLRATIMEMLLVKKRKVEQFFSISQMFEVPLQRSEYATTHIPMQRKIVPIAKKYNNEPLYCISDIEYKYILETIKHNVSTYERTPSSYKSMHEEDLRNILLAALNGVYQGSAMGEAFRNKGKTDICIEKENRAAFVAECKLWTGQGTVAKAINQLDGYLT